MRKKLTQAQIECYHRDGFVYPINALAAEEARRHRRAMEEFEAAQGRELTKGHNFKPHLLCVAVDEAGRDDPMARVDLLAPARVNGADARDAISAPWWTARPSAKAFFVQPPFNENLDHVLEMMKHPRSVVTFSDSGAHGSQIMDSSLQTQVLAYWVRRRQALTLEEGVRMLTLEPASAWGLHERGMLREGLAADVIIFDPDRVAPDMPEVVNDLPAGARRLRQKATGFHASIVNGQVVLLDGERIPAASSAGRLPRGLADDGVGPGYASTLQQQRRTRG